MSLFEGDHRQPAPSNTVPPRRNSYRQSEQYSDLARAAIMTSLNSTANNSPNSESDDPAPKDASHQNLMPPPKSQYGRTTNGHHKPLPANYGSLGVAMTDTPMVTPASTAPSSPQIHPRTQAAGTLSGTLTPSKIRATTLDIPGLTKSKVSPDGRIATRDVGAKLIIIMVGLPARGKSYIVKKITRYLNWSQHPTKIFNVGDRRRIAAGSGQSITMPPKTVESQLRDSVRKMSVTTGSPAGIVDQRDMLPPPVLATNILVNGQPGEGLPKSPIEVTGHARLRPIELPPPEYMDQSADFFDPKNAKAFQIREEVAYETLDELLKFVLEEGGSVGIHDATNSTKERRINLMKHIRERDPDINVLFLESRCQDKNLLEANMRLKLSGPDYKDKDPELALNDFQQRVEKYEAEYVQLGDYEEENNMPYCSMVDVGRKMVTHQVQGFLSIQTVTYLMNFNLAPRQIWLTRHGESIDNVNGRIGGDSHLSPSGHKYARALERFISQQRILWEQRQLEKSRTTHFPPRPGDTTPPNPEYTGQTGGPSSRNFCVWTSMLSRSIETSAHFCEDSYDLKQMRMLDELNAGSMEGMTYAQIRAKYHAEYELRKKDKLHYRYPGPGGEGYLDIINRLGKVILEIERMKDHVLIVGHRSITRVLLAYFQGLKQEDISDLDVPLGVLYMLEPRPYGVDFKAYRYHEDTETFAEDPNYKMRRATEPQAA